MTAENLRALADALEVFDGADLLDGDDGSHAVFLAHHGWAVLPLKGKVPLTEHGVLDASSDIDQVIAWWTRWPNANIGARVPEGLFVLDYDPRKDGAAVALAAIESLHGAFPDTLMVYSGRGDGGSHRYYRHPGGRLSATRLPNGFDVKTSSGYCVVPPSVHPEGKQEAYRWAGGDPQDAPGWLVDLLRPPPRTVIRRIASALFSSPGGGIADRYTEATTWDEVLTPHGWRCLDPDGDADGARWLHPDASSACSATIKNGCLFVYSPNTPFEVTEAGSPHGYTRFRAYAVLVHGGDLSVAARTLIAEGSQ